HRGAGAGSAAGPVTATTSVIERLRARIGVDGAPVTAPVEAGHVKRFAAAIGDPSPRWTKEAPPTFLVALAPVSLHLADAEEYGQGWLNGGNRFEHFAPVMIGDQVTSKGRVVDVYDKAGSSRSEERRVGKGWRARRRAAELK